MDDKGGAAPYPRPSVIAEVLGPGRYASDHGFHPGERTTERVSGGKVRKNGKTAICHTSQYARSH